MDIVKYNNLLNDLNFKGFTAKDFDFLMSICVKMKNQGKNVVTIPLSEIRAMSKYTTSNAKGALLKEIKGMNKKLAAIMDEFETDEFVYQGSLFFFKTDKQNLDIEVSVREDLLFILNDITKNFTVFELGQFVSLGSKYSKSLFRLLKQFRSTGKMVIGVDDLMGKMGAPVGSKAKFFNRDILKPSVDELRQYFPDLDYEVKRGSGRGRPIRGYEFSFKPDVTEKKSVEANKKPRKKKTKFSNFEERKYDFAELEKALLGS